MKELLPQYWKPSAAELIIPGGIIVEREIRQMKAC
jgi:hypothetical protein